VLIIGLGEAGNNIAELFKEHKQYHVEQLDAGKGLKSFENPEEYDEIIYKPRKKVIKSATEGILFVCGSGKVSGATLRILEALMHVRMTVVYICPDLEYSSHDEQLRHKVHYNILQEYARSGMISELLLLDNKTLIDLLGHGTIYNYFTKVNHYVYSAIHTLNYCKNVKAEFGKLHSPKNISRITTLGYGTLEKNEEKMFFPLDNITETSYIININEEELINDISILPNVKAMAKETKDLGRETSFAIWSTEEAESYYYTKHYTHFIQEIEKEE
tara:strand:+ start:1066 stop:1887 length:822 start_codon:yes stop_codon:yes gene_type:complete